MTSPSRRARILEQIIKLRDHASSVAESFPDEAAAFRRKALELMARHGIDHAEVRSAAAPAARSESNPSAAAGATSPPPLGIQIELRVGGLRARWRL